MTDALEPRQFLLLARQLAADRDPVKLRTAVGRAYYALFLAARKKIGCTVTTGAAHGIVRTALSNHKPSAGSKMEELRRLRNVADYELEPVNAADRNWVNNWKRVEVIALALLNDIDAMP